VAAARVLLERGVSASPEERSGIVREAVAQAALRLGNTPAVARESYVSPELLEAFERGDKRFRRSRTGDVSEAEAESFVIRLLAAGRGAGTQPP
jgi:DNA topoisomerase IB